jgi:hypothetical protein
MHVSTLDRRLCGDDAKDGNNLEGVYFDRILSLNYCLISFISIHLCIYKAALSCVVMLEVVITLHTVISISYLSHNPTLAIIFNHLLPSLYLVLNQNDN